MDLTEPPGTTAYRHEVRRFVAANTPEGWEGIGALDLADRTRFVEGWRSTLAENGLLAPSWPREIGGGDLTAVEQIVLAEELERAGLPRGNETDLFSIDMLGNTLLRWGTPEQQQHFLPRILAGTDRWCQGFSEPGAGSDLAGLRCTATADGGEWRIDGQKTWTSAASSANWIFVLARTAPPETRHRGLTFILCPLDQPGVEVRPITMMSGGSDFNEVFFTDARAPIDHVVGQVDGGWPVAMTLLGHERGEAAACLPLVFRTELDRLVELARATGRNGSAVVRQEIARCYTNVEILRFLGLRGISRILRGEEPGPEAGVFKLAWSEHHRSSTDVGLDVLGAAAMAPEGRGPLTSFHADEVGAPNDSASWVGTFYNARAGTIYAGTSEIQRNILAEMVLGLPKEARR